MFKCLQIICAKYCELRCLFQKIAHRQSWRICACLSVKTLLDYFEYFCQISSKSIVIISRYTTSKLMPFLRHSVCYVSIATHVFATTLNSDKISQLVWCVLNSLWKQVCIDGCMNTRQLTLMLWFVFVVVCWQWCSRSDRWWPQSITVLLWGSREICEGSFQAQNQSYSY